MGNKRSKELKIVATREKIFKELAKSTEMDLITFRIKMVKSHFVDSGNKFDAAIESLKENGRVVQRGKTITVAPNAIKTGTYFQSGNKSYVVMDGENKQYGIDRKYTEGVNSNQRVKVGFTYLTDTALPFIVSADKSAQQTNTISHTERQSLVPTLEPSNLVYGKVMKTDHDNLIFIPNDKHKYKGNIVILNDKKTLAKYQDKICTMEVVSNDVSGTTPAMGFLKEIKGEAGNPIQEYDAIAESHGANMSWGDERVQEEIKKIPTEVDLTKYSLINENGQLLTSDGKERIVDLRGLAFSTTDPATCKDMDDAIYSTFDEEGNLVVYTAVANVSKYVDLNSEIGRRYIKGSFTTYAPNKAYNILPPELSTNICSLNPNVDRLALVVKSVVDVNTGKPIKSFIMDAVIQSQEKYSYEQAQEITDKNPELTLNNLKEKVKLGLSHDEQVVMNEKASKVLWKGFQKRDLLQFDSNNEYDVKFNDDMSNILDLTKEPDCAYHKVIEAFMLTANEATAKYAKENNIPNVYRVHDAPNEDKLEQAYEFFGYLDLPFEGDLSPRATKELIKIVKDTPKEKVVNNFLIRMQSKAKYSITTNPKDVEFISDRKRANDSKRSFGGHAAKGIIENKKYHKGSAVRNMLTEIKDLETDISHFGLQSEQYSHTTSPIRRLPDYITHYNILASMKGTNILDEDNIRDMTLWANQMQDENDLAEREFNELNGAIYAENNINKIMKGYICGFKKLSEGKKNYIEDLAVIVENEDTGVRVEIPALEILATKGFTNKRVTISPHGSALINSDNSKPLISLCSEVDFKIASANRVTRQVLASTNLQKDFTIESPLNIEDAIPNIQQNTELTRRQRMLLNTEFKHNEEDEELKRIELEKIVGRKHLKLAKEKTGIEGLDEEDAYEFNRNSNIVHKLDRYKNYGKDEIEDIKKEDIDFSKQDDFEKDE